ncbi:MAG TPA: cobalamin-binding protein [Methanoregulaceae archaeon]|nr:cobalamin-binding protein [Methanoregulaceae archaeon]
MNVNMIQDKPDNMHVSKRHITLTIVLFVGFIVLPATAVALTDDMGTAVIINGTPQRIISLSPSNTEILYALGLGDRIIGVTEYCNYPPEALEKPKIGGYNTVNIEKVIALKPDLILASYGNGEEILENLRMLGYPVVALHPRTLADVLDNIRLVGKAAGAEANAAALAGGLEQRINAVEERAGMASERPTVAHVIWNDPIYVSGKGTFQDELIMKAGGENAFPGVEGWKNIGIEDFIHADPDVLIVNAGSGMGGGEDAIARFFRNEPRFAGVTAIKENRISIVDSDTVDRAGPRIVDALEMFAAAIHPELFGNDTPVMTPTQGARVPGFGMLIACMACIGAGLIAMRKGF